MYDLKNKINLVREFTPSVNFILLWNMLFCLGLSIYTVLYNLYLNEIVSLAHIGSIVGVSYLSYALFSIIAGYFSIRFGPKYVLLVGILILLGGIIGGLFTHSLSMLFFWAFFTGIGQASTNVMFVPLLTEHSKESERVKLFSVAYGTGNLFMFLGTLGSGAIADYLSAEYSISSVDSLRTVILAAAVCLVLSSVPLLFVKNGQSKKNEMGEKKKFNMETETSKNLFSYAVVKLVEGIGIGLTIPYINLFLSGRFEINTTTISLVLSIATLATVALIFVNPLITKRYGENSSIIYYQFLGIPCLVFLCFSSNIFFASLSIIIFRAAFYGKMPIQSKIVMDNFPVNARGFSNSLGSMAFMLGTGAAGFFSTKIVAQFGIDKGYSFLFLASALCIGFSSVLFYRTFKKKALTPSKLSEAHAS